jgi:hypothetical protein
MNRVVQTNQLCACGAVRGVGSRWENPTPARRATNVNNLVHLDSVGKAIESTRARISTVT